MAVDAERRRVAVTSMGEATMEQRRRQRSVRYELVKNYPVADDRRDARLVGRAEIIRMAGYDPDTIRGANWWQQYVAHKNLPPADGQVVDDKPTWRRETILLHFYQRTHIQRRTRYLPPEYWPEAEALLASMQAAS